LAAVKKMATEIQQSLPKLDILINNAGVYKSPVQKNQNGLDIRYVVNYLAPFLLTKELLPLLKKGNTPRIINLSSAAQAPVSIEALKGNIPLNEMEAYAQSKLALTMWSLYLAQTESLVTTIAVNPGSLLNTNMVQQGWGFHRSSADKGRDILCNLAILEEHKNASGQYFDNDMEAFNTIHPSGNNTKAIEVLIKETIQLLSACL
jgi:NAD(P)-dependent dehydrogenase (short-subunit alcohol dehydrogenase family)